MESLYYVLSWACHRRCRHCYDTRFRPYVRGALESVVAEGESAHARIVDHLPERMTWLDRKSPREDGSLAEKTGRIVLSGGEVLLDPVRTRILYPVIERLQAKYRGRGGVRIIVQTTGDLLTERLLDELLGRDVWMISIASVDEYHVGMEGARGEAFVEGLREMFAKAGVKPSGLHAPIRSWAEEDGPVYDMFGANEGEWIGALWPRGRAFENGIGSAGMADNFCKAWSGGLGFLDHEFDGSEVSIEPNGNVYPCCIKTAVPIGNLVEEPLVDILGSLRGHPAFEAIHRGDPARMGERFGWSREDFENRSTTTTPKGTAVSNLCIGCDAFHREVLAPAIAAIREARLARRTAAE